jgi:hypothetical protein
LHPGHHPVITDLAVPTPVGHVLADLSRESARRTRVREARCWCSGLGRAGLNAMMALAHLLAAAAVGLWLAQGERALWTVLALTAAGARELVQASVVAFLRVLRDLAGILGAAHVVRRIPCLFRTAPAPRLLLLARVLSRRGPPALLIA